MAWCVLHFYGPEDEVPEVSAKVRWYAAHPEIQTLFVGSSRVRRQIAPNLFDQAAAESGFQTKSYNLGIDAMTSPELGHVVREILKIRPPRLLVMDLNALRRKLPVPPQETSIRDVHWHTPRQTAVVLRAIAADAGGRPFDLPALSLSWRHTMMMAEKTLRIGSGGRSLKAFLMQKIPRIRPVGANGTGYFPESSPLDETARRQLETFRAAGARPKRILVDPVLTEELTTLTRVINQKGTAVIFFHGPVVGETRTPEPIQDAQRNPPIIAFDDPERHADLYDARHRYDLQHLNAAGAEIFSKAIGAEIGRAIAQPPLSDFEKK